MMELAFRKMLVDIGYRLSPKDLQALKYLCRDFIPRGRLEDIDDPQDFWDALEERGKLSPNNIEFLKTLVLGCCAGQVNMLSYILTKYEQDYIQYTDLRAEMQFIVKNIGRDWKEFARSLGISEPDLDCIIDDHPRDLKERVRQCLILWQKYNYGKISKQDLVTALKSCSRNDLAYKIQSSTYWQDVNLLLPDGRKLILTAALPMYRRVYDTDGDTIKAIKSNHEKCRPTETIAAVHSEAASTSQSQSDNNETIHEWTDSEVRKLLGLIKDNLDKLTAAGAIWRQIGQKMDINQEKCMDKYKYLRKAYRNHCQLNNKTGAAPSKFEFSTEMEDLMGDDPSVTPLYTESSDSQDDNTSKVNDDSNFKENSTPVEMGDVSSKNQRKRGADVLISYLQKRDEGFKKLKKDMHHEYMEAMNRLIDKL